MRTWVILALLLATPGAAHAQFTSRDTLRVDAEGITVASADGTTRLTFRFRAQLQATASIPPEDSPADPSMNAQVRRARLRLNGTLWDPRFGVSLQIGLAGSDHTGGNPGEPAVIRDAHVFWQQTPRLRFTAGLGKLPGNKQRTISSADLQFAERSVVNNTFTTDRDFMVMAAYAYNGAVPWTVSSAISTGEGRASAGNDMGLAYTARLEVQPLGAFSSGNTTWEGDQAREPEPRLNVGVVVSHNDRARRSRGQLGDPTNAQRDLTTLLADVMLKYNGWALFLEGAHRDAGPTTGFVAPGADPRGIGGLAQLSYLTRAGWEPAIRMARVELRDDTNAAQISVNLTRYLRAHRVKYMLEAGREWGSAPSLSDRWLLRANLEFGI